MLIVPVQSQSHTAYIPVLLSLSAFLTVSALVFLLLSVLLTVSALVFLLLSVLLTVSAPVFLLLSVLLTVFAPVFHAPVQFRKPPALLLRLEALSEIEPLTKQLQLSSHKDSIFSFFLPPSKLFIKPFLQLHVLPDKLLHLTL